MDKLNLLERLRLQDVLTVVELLKLSTDDIVDAFLDKIDDNHEEINEALE